MKGMRWAASLFLAWLAPLATGAEPIAGEYTAEGSANCLECHNKVEAFPVLSIFHTVHGVIGDSSSPEGQKGCESCHGPSKGHADDPRKVAPGVGFGPKWVSPAGERAAACNGCHDGGNRIHWAGSAHEREEVACNDCHGSHAQQDPILDVTRQVEACLKCHQQQKVEMNMPYRHPIREGETPCSDCHNPHGTGTLALLKQPSLTETCIGCHKEKRGPFLFEHAPVAEDCSLCHTAHGSVQPALLESRPPFLCQRCHMANFHPSELSDGSGLPGVRPDPSLLGKGCVNCHSQVHGSNHPAGARLMR